ncbi:phosphatase PAP2 family protein [Streptomyces sp. NPDC006739]|uniref:phosphatase PAP2 family protein n=1 Tax=Streptomyces sp. NPDC006739 TaxID=3364763 RepID=UPI003680B871
MTRRHVAELSGSVALGAWAAFGVLAMVAAGGHGAPLLLDHRLLSWSVGHRPEMAVAVARGLTATGTGVVPYLLVVLAGLLVGRTGRQRLTAAVLWAACLGLGQAVRYGVMELVARPRPPQYEWQTHASGWSYPSGHTTTAALTAGLLLIALRIRAPRGRTPLAVAVACWGACVGLTRVYLGVHWSTDVLGGWLFALGWLGLCVWATSWHLPDRLTAAPPGPAPAPPPQHPPVDPPTAPTPDSPPTGTRSQAAPEDHATQDPGRRGRSRPA